ncbi:peptidoglycan-binding domain-containing protein [Teredinibacter turnerae]|uniref:peptidoglycan-binding domain-containing protein n=1 Tax=Teredinibacter turnerae TaxID=2426 RepID=UPI0003719441|nr:peptidoglycan-binding domain-containing protein [Teredinibacter turnerae]
MPKGIMRSVGKGAVNQHRDVKLIQIYLNLFITLDTKRVKLTVDGKIGRNTISAIEHFQKNSAGMNFPDGRVDPNGKTFRYLTLYLDEAEQNKIEASLNEPSSPPKAIASKDGRILAGLSNLVVTYNGVVASRQIVSDYSINVIRLALKESGMNKAVITSTLRTPEDQATIMLRNAKINLGRQYSLYGARGDAVLKIYENNKSKKDSEIVELMVKKIEEYAKEGKRVSKHCVSIEDYKSLNVIDIGYNSTKSVCKNFSESKFSNALKSLESEGYIEKYIDETKKSNSCWHIEIKPNKKSVFWYNKDSILFPVRFINSEHILC